MKILIISIILLLLTIIKQKVVEKFTSPTDCLSSANKHLIQELSNTKDPKKREKIVNAISYIDFIKTIIY